MGQSSSSRRNNSFRAAKRRSFGERKGSFIRRPKRELSATFNMYKEDFHIEFLNINTATEEELMTLPGITRTIAHNIIDYRQAIGQFKKVEDLALVSGVGANRLALIRTEICVNMSRRRRNSRSSSSNGTHSEDSIAGTSDHQELKSSHNGDGISNGVNGYDSTDKICPFKLIDVNGASIFQLMAVRGINQKMAANIVCYRDRKGPFKSMDDVAKVKGIGHKKVSELRLYLCVNDSSENMNGYVKHMANGTVKASPVRRSSSVPVTSNDLTDSVVSPATVIPSGVALEELSGNAEDIFDDKVVYELLSARCPRPEVTDRFHFKRNDQPALRLGSWNLENFTMAKASNLGVVEVVCRTILENGISLIAFQDVKDPLAVKRLCNELNAPYLNKIKSWVGPTGIWRCYISESISLDGQEPEYLAFLYESCHGITLVKSETLNFTPSNNNGPSLPGAFYATFKVENIEFSVLSVRVPPDFNSCVSMTAILQAWLDKVKETSLLIVLGDFNANPLSKEFSTLSERFVKLVSSDTLSDLEPISENGFCQDVWLSLSVQKFYSGHSGVVRNGLCHLTIPKGWSWGGAVSSNFPVWTEFYVPSLLSLSVLSDEADLKCEEESS